MDIRTEKPENPEKGDHWFDEESGLLMEFDGKEWRVIESDNLQGGSFPCPACGSPLDNLGHCANEACETFVTKS